MSWTLALDVTPQDRDETAASPMVAVVSFGLVVGFPTAFWLAVVELAVSLSGIEYGTFARTGAAVLLIGLLTVVWSMFWSNASKAAAVRSGSR